MDRYNSQEIINKYNLISHKDSKHILEMIRNGEEIKFQSLPNYVNVSKLQFLREVYQQKIIELKKLGRFKKYPKNLPFYYIIKDRFPSFTWEIDDNIKSSFKIRVPRVENLRPSLMSLLINDNIAKDITSDHKYTCIRRLPDKVAENMEHLLKEIHAVYPDNNDMEGIISWLLKGLAGAKLTMFSPACPDYSKKRTDDKICRYIHTFSELGSNIGLIAQRILDALPIFDKFFKKYNISVKYIIATGDFEAYVKSNLERLNITTQEFLSKLKGSNDLIRKASKVPIDVFMFTDLCGGYDKWIVYYSKYIGMFEKGCYGKTNLNKNSLFNIIKARKALYDRWTGKKSELGDYLPQLLGQGAEYASMGEIISKKYTDCLILGADHSVMSPFYNINQIIPTLYLKRFYN